ncbi:MAG: hypothetical protein IPL22_23000 [Bacteroidetes bacterium]|nr:hypothetical protein [Bacteroidota bacterium]
MAYLSAPVVLPPSIPTFTDPNGDSLYLTSSGNIFNSTLFNPAASLANAAGDGIVSSQFCWSTECGMARSTPYQFVASVTDNGCPPKITNQIYSIKVNPGPANPVPSISILANPSGPVCIGTLVTFTALPTFGGTNPSFQWQLNGVNVGTNSSSWSSSTLNNGDVITVSMVSNSICVNCIQCCFSSVCDGCKSFCSTFCFYCAGSFGSRL